MEQENMEYTVVADFGGMAGDSTNSMISVVSGLFRSIGADINAAEQNMAMAINSAPTDAPIVDEVSAMSQIRTDMAELVELECRLVEIMGRYNLSQPMTVVQATPYSQIATVTTTVFTSPQFAELVTDTAYWQQQELAEDIIYNVKAMLCEHVEATDHTANLEELLEQADGIIRDIMHTSGPYISIYDTLVALNDYLIGSGYNEEDIWTSPDGGTLSKHVYDLCVNLQLIDPEIHELCV